MSQPSTLAAAVTDAVHGVSQHALAEATRRVSKRYREPRTGLPYIRSDLDALAYVAYRLPATYAAVSAVLKQARLAAPEWQPTSLIDVGAGAGTASWSAVQAWPSIQNVELLEKDERMIALGKRLALYSEHRALVDAVWTPLDARESSGSRRADVVIASYMLGEIAEEHRESTVEGMWRAATDAVFLIEPGTPAGFATVRSARETLLDLGAHIVAPCPHDSACPIAAGDWCHFSARLPRSKLHRDLKGADMGYEDEKFSYVVAHRRVTGPREDRVLRHPLIRPGQIRFKLCTREGLREDSITRRDGPQFRRARHVEWGDSLPPR
jgi:ribosomal protein RSM22 (predicted rRNA methylase)